jgi:hypothetical protein
MIQVDADLVDVAACKLAERLIAIDHIVRLLEALAETVEVGDQLPELADVRLEINGLAAAVLDLFDIPIVVNPSSTIH